MKPVSIILTEPLAHDGKKVGEVTIRRPKVKDLRALDNLPAGSGDLSRGIEMAAILTGLPSAVIDEMDASDFAKISDAIASFLPKPQE